MYCSLDWLTRRIALARVHPVGGLGDPWTWGCVILKRGDTAVILLAQTKPTHDEARAFLRALDESGMTRRRFERHGSDGRIRVVTAGRRLGWWEWLTAWWGKTWH